MLIETTRRSYGTKSERWIRSRASIWNLKRERSRFVSISEITRLSDISWLYDPRLFLELLSLFVPIYNHHSYYSLKIRLFVSCKSVSIKSIRMESNSRKLQIIRALSCLTSFAFYRSIAH